MKATLIVVGVFCIILLTETVVAGSPYGKIDVYYNNKLLPGTEVAKPILKIGEPFNIKINMTVYQEYKVSGLVSEIGDGNFEVVEGPSKMNRYTPGIILKPNESHIFEWTVKPTEGWAGGSLPINFHYSIVEKGNPEPVLNSEFTVAYCTILNEHYKGKPSVSKQPTTETQPATKSTPAFTAIGTLLSVALALVIFRR